MDDITSLKEKMNRTWIDRDLLDQILKDRLDFGFDSLYFRYENAIDELARYKEIEANQTHQHFNAKAWADAKKMHFYNVLEQLVHAHTEDDK